MASAPWTERLGIAARLEYQTPVLDGTEFDGVCVSRLTCVAASVAPLPAMSVAEQVT